MKPRALETLDDWRSPPGDTIADALEEFGRSRAWLAEVLGGSRAGVDALIAGHTPITAALARGLSAALGATPEFWIRRDEHYRRPL